MLQRLWQKWDWDSSRLWCIIYIDSNTFRRDRVGEILRDAGVLVKSSEEHLFVTQEQYDQALVVLKHHGY
ncbi:hypothetical protein [Ammoniphilus sp. CFH 90114]|uniref:hypothetical protein n=1 Tax=Ammoniphilus sp. CFH 90114 TaxID=2493665 RepID=UPI00100FF9A9|nr:hypothetical protein [Ammoniphilus sp. CFH 90114]RXT03721.1 hypothetical protein EIZ39_23000 [Ammoniphilus sp. CFH 90114]